MEPFDDLVKYAAKWAHSVLKSDGTDGDCLLFENPSDDVIIPMIGEALRAVRATRGCAITPCGTRLPAGL
jgi:hypothetical protein